MGGSPANFRIQPKHFCHDSSIAASLELSGFDGADMILTRHMQARSNPLSDYTMKLRTKETCVSNNLPLYRTPYMHRYARQIMLSSQAR